MEREKIRFDEEIKKKFPKEFTHTKKVKNKYLEYEEVKKYAENAGFKCVLISPKKETIGVSISLNLIVIPENYLPNIKKLKDFAPDFLDKGMKHTLGDIKEKIPGHEGEHTKGKALEISLKNKNSEKEDFYAELQRISKQKIAKDKEIIDAIALTHFFWLSLHLGIENALKMEIDKKNYSRFLAESPSEAQAKGLLPYLKLKFLGKYSFEWQIKGMFPYFKKSIIDKVPDKMDEIRDYLKEKYEEKYGKTEKEESMGGST